MDRAREYNIPLYLCFVDFQKVFDNIFQLHTQSPECDQHGKVVQR